jgi:hypothetical protein
VASDYVDPLIAAHREWIGYVQPTGLLVAPAALAHRGVVPDRNIAERQKELDLLTQTSVSAPRTEAQRIVADFPTFATAFLGWSLSDIVGLPEGRPLPEDLGTDLIEYGERLVPTYAIPAAGDGSVGWQMLITVERTDVDFDTILDDDGRQWAATPHARFERLLRDTNIPIGLLTNSRSFRLVYAPKGETSGFATFDLESMLEVAGRPMLSAFHLLLNVNRLFGAADTSLASLLAESRQYQETVSTQLAEQVLVALNELVRGFYVADVRTHRTLTVDLATRDPQHLYSGLLTALMRLVFVLYAEDRDLFPRDDVWEQNYSLGGLFRRLRDDAALFPDTMDERYGAWAHLLVLWRLVYAGGGHGSLKLTARYGRMFDPDRFAFLDGRRDANASVDIPAISDGVVWRILQGLMMIDGERLSYRTLDVEQIGSVYQSVMGFTIELTAGTSLAIRPQKSSGAAATINLELLLAEPAGKRTDWLAKRTDRKLTPKAAASVKAAVRIADLEVALAGVTDIRITPKPLSAGVPVLQPTQTRRRSGSHYTPRALTAPIVAETLRPIFERLGPEATAADILSLRVLDPALGSGAFLVEACRQLAERLTRAWELHSTTPTLPPDEDALLHARRLVAQRCLYGVDRNAMAADLAKLSIWLTTLAKDHEFTFVDHAIRHGDALVGLSRQQIEALHWAPTVSLQLPFVADLVRSSLQAAAEGREQIRASGDGTSERDLSTLLHQVEDRIADVCLVANATLHAFFSQNKTAARERERQRVIGLIGQSERSEELHAFIRQQPVHLAPFHWTLEFPEVFDRVNPGFDAIVGNPPYAGKNTIAAANPPNYIAWLQTLHEEAHGNADLVAHFFRRAFDFLRSDGTLGLIATNTIRQGDTRNTGLRWIRQHEGTIYNATRRYRWPGEAAVVVSVIHIAKGSLTGPAHLDGRVVPVVTAYLFDQGFDDDPAHLAANANLSFQGSIPLGMGFTFDDTDKKGIASPLSLMHELAARDPRNAERIKPYIGGEEVLSEPDHHHHRYIIDFGNMTLDEAGRWPDLLEIVKARVKPQRDSDNRSSYRKYWWRFAERRSSLYYTIRSLDRVLVKVQTTSTFAFCFVPNGAVYDQKLIVFALSDLPRVAVLQSRIHETWALFFGSSFKDDPVYTPSDVFETFPFPRWFARIDRVEELGRRYFDFRADLMLRRGVGLSAIYNCFHNPRDQSTEMQMLRSLQSQIDRFILDSYGWTDIDESATFVPEWSDERGEGPMHFTWPVEARDEVLARLLILNEERAREESRLGLARIVHIGVDDPLKEPKSETTGIL